MTLTGEGITEAVTRALDERLARMRGLGRPAASDMSWAVDTAAVMSILLGEPDAPWFREQIADTDSCLNGWRGRPRGACSFSLGGPTQATNHPAVGTPSSTPGQ